MLVDVDCSPFWEFIRRRQSHIPSPCGAALLLLLLGICHETYIRVVFGVVRMWAMRIAITKYHLSGLNGF
ncbi:hypothetical protein GQ457_14G004200 [Hibiscus cannabinus]